MIELRMSNWIRSIYILIVILRRVPLNRIETFFRKYMKRSLMVNNLLINMESINLLSVYLFILYRLYF